MSVKKIIFLFIVFPFSCLAQNDWQLIKDENQVQVFIKDIPGSKLKELKTIAQFNASIDAFLSLLTDIPSMTKYQFGCLSSTSIEKKSMYEQYFYQTLYMPWPFTNRDGVFKQVVSPKSNQNELFVETFNQSQYVPNKENFVRVPSMHSSWHVKKLNDKTILGEFNLRVDPGGEVPSWLVNLFIDKGPFQSMLTMRNLLNEAKFKNAHIHWLYQ